MCFFKAFRIKRLTKKIMALQQHRLNHQVRDEDIKQECMIYHKLYYLYTKMRGNKHYPFALETAIECLRVAAQLHDVEAQFIIGKHFLEEANWRAELEQNKIFASARNQKLMHDLFSDAHAYLAEGDKEGHILAKRYYGLCFIFGWGTAVDKDKGFALVVESIAKENAWSKAPQIFAQLGLNKPEFYEAFTKQQAKHTS
ncbi:MAG: hypothetical protein A3F18_05440 [Legionellales bacterium RIFCSPHIGHO2_12_FULL_37_14]|nr:MAG: hypothetical protein A3F18_05440 [Legionellales bacterium RIFCSPHIGHO2_12_FULL_37_14]